MNGYFCLGPETSMAFGLNSYTIVAENLTNWFKNISIRLI